MDRRKREALSKRLSYVLRHRPDAIGIELDDAGWVDLDVLVVALRQHGEPVSREQLVNVVETNDKQRFAFSSDGCSIRASQGHSITVELGYEPRTPPETLYHGTVGRFAASILERGLARGRRHHVHLSRDAKTAESVGGRRGNPVVLEVRAGDMARAGFRFFLSETACGSRSTSPPNTCGDRTTETRHPPYVRCACRAACFLSLRPSHASSVRTIRTRCTTATSDRAPDAASM